MSHAVYIRNTRQCRSRISQMKNANHKGGVPTHYFVKFSRNNCMEMKKIVPRREGIAFLVTLLGSANGILLPQLTYQRTTAIPKIITRRIIRKTEIPFHVSQPQSVKLRTRFQLKLND